MSSTKPRWGEKLQTLLPHDALDNVVLGLEFRSAPWSARLFGAKRRRAETEAERMIDAVGLTHVQGASPASLSGGMQQRLAIAQAVILHPKILLLDEPFGALDPGIRDDMHTLITRLWQETGMTVFMVTHDMREAARLAQHIVIVLGGAVVQQGPTAEVLENPTHNYVRQLVQEQL